MRKVLLFVFIFIVALAGCTEKEDYGSGIRPDTPSYIPKDCVFRTVGLKNPGASEEDPDRYPSFTYKGYAPLKDKPVEVYYYVPEGETVSEIPVLFTFTGAERTGNTQLNAWKHLADEYGFAVINPQFAKENYTENEYQFGGVVDSEGAIRDKSLWTFNIVESLFDYWLKEVDGNQEGYRMFGHSAGAQFVGRMMMSMPESRVIRAVAANPSSWAWPVSLSAEGKVFGWPYSISNLPDATGRGYLQRVFSNTLIVQLGTKDTGTESLDEREAAFVQGENRYERGRNFYDACVAAAAEAGISCAFNLAEVKDVGHSTWHMVYGKYKPTATEVAEDKLGKNSAYLLLFI